MDDGQERSSIALTLTATGVTLLGVLLSIGMTVAFGISGPWWARLLAGAGSTLVLVVLVKVATSRGRGPLARAANWMISAHDDEDDASAGRQSPRHGRSPGSP